MLWLRVSPSGIAFGVPRLRPPVFLVPFRRPVRAISISLFLPKFLYFCRKIETPGAIQPPSNSFAVSANLPPIRMVILFGVPRLRPPVFLVPFRRPGRAISIPVFPV
jgi:hypothetical protein